MNLTLLVLAAGMGSRYGGMKQLDPVGPNGEPIMDYSLYDATRAGFNKVVFVIRPDMEELFHEQIGKRFEQRMAVEYAFQTLDALPGDFTPPEGRTKPWGTGHAVLVAADKVQEPFAVVNADDFYGASSYQLLADQLRAEQPTELPEYVMVGFVLKNTLSPHGTVSRGICHTTPESHLADIEEYINIGETDGTITSINDSGEPTTLTGNETVSMNMWGFPPSLFANLESAFSAYLAEHADDIEREFYFPAAVNDMIKQGKARANVLRAEDQWFGVTHRDDKPFVVKNIQKLIAAGAYPEKLWN